MSKLKNNKISFPHVGNYHVAIEPLMQVMNGEVITPPPITKRTIELGFKHSPEAVCIPFKYNLGNYIEALEQGANFLIQAGGGCRFGYYGEVQETILKSLGFKFDFIKLNNRNNPLGWAVEIKKLNPKISYYKILCAIALAASRVFGIDKVEDYTRKNIGFEKNPGEFDALTKKFLSDLKRTKSWRQALVVSRQYQKKFKQIAVAKPINPIRVGVVGELYLLMEPFSNFNLEKKLASYGIEVYRFTNFTNILHETFTYNRYVRKLLKHARPYLKYHIGAHGTESVAKAHKLIKLGFDGIIHIKPFGCMPEVNAMSALYRISKDYKVPVIYFSFDSQTSETGINTRLEAFYDMISMKRNNIKQKNYYAQA